MKTSIATVSISGDLREKIAAIADAGFSGVEIFENDLLAFDGTPAAVGAMVRDHGLELCLFQPFRDFEGMPEPQRQRAFDRAERKFDLMEALGTDLILVCSNVSPAALGGVDRAADDLRELGERARKRGLRVSYEALAWGRHVNDHRDAWEVVRRADHPHVGLCLDSFHSLSRAISSDTILSIPADKIFFVQLADAPAMQMDLLSWSRHYRNMPGEGDLPVADFVRAVLGTGYRGYFSLEVFNDQFRAGSPKSVAIDGKRSLVNLFDAVGRDDPALGIDLPAIPPRIEARGVAFVEFAANEEEAAALKTLFRGLGFRKAARHISKDVTLWRQADAGEGAGVNLVLNTERGGFAHAAYSVHGTSVCAFGLLVDDAALTVERARALGAKLFEQAVGPGELDIPSIRGVGGGLIYFLDERSELGRVWDIEFEPVADERAPMPAGLQAVDHLAQTMNYEEMLSWLLFYVSIFKTAKTPMVDVVDSGGLVRSQAIESADGALRITLNGAESRHTLAGRFIAESFGSSVQHVAFSTADIFPTARALEANGLKPLEISANYYDDLEARFGLDPAFTDTLRASGLLYDRDENGGEYFQLYSPLYGEGFFFEVVERRGGYKGYGANNAQFRIAAQKRYLAPKGMPAI